MQPLDDRLARYAAEVARFARALNLTGARTPEAFLERLARPSLELLRWMPGRGTLLDVGSGNGIPGVPLLLARPELAGVFVERRAKRAEFLRHLARTLALPARVIAGDAARIAPVGADVLVARAVADEDALLAWSARHLEPAGRAVLVVPAERAPRAHPGWVLQEDARVAGMRVRVWQRGGFT